MYCELPWWELRLNEAAKLREIKSINIPLSRNKYNVFSIYYSLCLVFSYIRTTEIFWQNNKSSLTIISFQKLFILSKYHVLTELWIIFYLEWCFLSITICVWWCKVWSYYLVIASTKTIRLPERHKPRYTQTCDPSILDAISSATRNYLAQNLLPAGRPSSLILGLGSLAQ